MLQTTFARFCWSSMHAILSCVCFLFSFSRKFLFSLLFLLNGINRNANATVREDVIRTPGSTVGMFWRHVGEWCQTGTRGRELDKSRWRPTLKQERDFSINKTHSEDSLNWSSSSARRIFNFEGARRNGYGWEESVVICSLSRGGGSSLSCPAT